jgi:biotin transporter BioY
MTDDSLLPDARWIDPRGQRFGAGVSAVLLVVAWLVGAPWLAALVGLDLAVSSALGVRFFLPGKAWPAVRSALHLGPTDLEHEYPPRFAQALGATFIGLAVIAFLLGQATLAWLLVGAVAGLQVLLAATGYCLGCRLYFLRWWVPSRFSRLFRRGDHVSLSFGGSLARPRS